MTVPPILAEHYLDRREIESPGKTCLLEVPVYALPGCLYSEEVSPISRIFII